MKQILLLLLLISQIAFAQAPQSFKYQAVARDGAGVLMVNKIISVKTSILLGSPTGSVIYAETQTLATNDYGVITLNIGAGTLVSGSFSTISWGTNTFYVKTELDVNGGSNYLFMGTTQIMSVPYALYAEKSGNALADNDTSKTNELQTLAVTGHTLSISQKNYVLLPPDADHDTINELQTLSLSGTTLTISRGNSITLNGTVDLDFDPNNELQLLSRGNDTLYLSKGNFVVLPKNNDNDSTNEIQTLAITGNTITISNANSINLPVNLDNDSTNEIQSLTINQGTINLSKANKIHLPDSSSSNEIQTISLSKDTLSLSKNGSTVFLGKYLELPVGSIIPFAGNVIPAGYLFCDGSAINRIQYQDLFNSLGTSWGAGNGSSTFNLPDLRGNFLRGLDSTANVDADKNSRTAKYSGGNTGNQVGSYQADELKTHKHDFTILDPCCSNLTGPAKQGGGAQYSSVPTTYTGGSETRPKNVYVKYIIRY